MGEVILLRDWQTREERLGCWARGVKRDILGHAEPTEHCGPVVDECAGRHSPDDKEPA